MNYVIVGLFVLVLGTALVTVGVWLAATRSENDYVTYVVYVSESVSGLNTKAAVKHRGVDVGLVREIALDRDNPGRGGEPSERRCQPGSASAQRVQPAVHLPRRRPTWKA